jgi:hypothetical protein
MSLIGRRILARKANRRKPLSLDQFRRRFLGNGAVSVGSGAITVANSGSLTISGSGSMTVGGNLSANGTITTGYTNAYLNSSGYPGYKPTGRRNKVWRLGRFTIIWRRRP